MESEIGDIRNLEQLTKSMVSFNPDILVHMAAQPLVRLSYEEPVNTYTTNVIGTVNVLEAARKCSNLKAIVSVTTDGKCYETMSGNGATEKMSLWEVMIHIAVVKVVRNWLHQLIDDLISVL